MKDALTYKGYVGSVHYSDEDEVFYGKVEFIRDLVSFEATDVASLKNAFTEAVDDYLEFSREQGKEADVPFKGSFNVRTGHELHRQASLYAKEKEMSLNAVITEALQQYLDTHR